MNCKDCGGYCCENIPIQIFKHEAEYMRTIKPEIKFKDFQEFFYLEAPCPFFKDNQCSIYEKRPMICRSYPVGIQEKEGVFLYYKRTECPERDNLKGNELYQTVWQSFQGLFISSIILNRMKLKIKNKMKMYQKLIGENKPEEKQTKVEAKIISSNVVNAFTAELIKRFNKEFAKLNKQEQAQKDVKKL